MIGIPDALKGSKMVLIKGGREVIIYGRASQVVFYSIWSFNVGGKTWTLVNNMTQGR